jgi:hypothetical protein
MSIFVFKTDDFSCVDMNALSSPIGMLQFSADGSIATLPWGALLPGNYSNPFDLSAVFAPRPNGPSPFADADALGTSLGSMRDTAAQSLPSSEMEDSIPIEGTLLECHPSSNRLQALLRELQQLNPMVSELRLGGNCLGDGGLQSVLKVLQLLPTVTSLDLTFSQITAAGVHLLRETLMLHAPPAGSATVHRADVSWAEGGNRGSSGIGCGLQAVGLAWNDLEDTGAEELAELLRLPSGLLHLSAAHCGITNKGALFLRDAMRSNTRLEFMGLNGNAITDVSILDNILTATSFNHKNALARAEQEAQALRERTRSDEGNSASPLHSPGATLRRALRLITASQSFHSLRRGTSALREGVPVEVAPFSNLDIPQVVETVDGENLLDRSGPADGGHSISAIPQGSGRETSFFMEAAAF